MKKVLMYSGGWDSYCASKLMPDAKKIYVNLHTPYSEIEIKNLPNDVEIQDINLQKYVLKDGYHIPQRNAILALIGIASVMAEAEKDNDYDITIYICGMKEDLTAPDKSPLYFERLTKLANSFGDNRWNIQIKGFFDEDKISLWERAGKPDMRNIISCYTGNNCGECIDCKRRLLYLNYLYPEEYKINKEEFIKELQENNWIVDEKILENRRK